jgi:hypothetical protein
MRFALVAGIYGCSILAALLLLYFLRPKAWYWHLLSVAAALVIGLTPFPEGWHSPTADLVVGAVFLFLFFWGAGAIFFLGARRRQARQA